MKKVVLTIIVLATALTAMAQATQPCIVKQYNQKQRKTPLAGVQVEVRDAQSATSEANGSVTLHFATLKPGDRVTPRRITKQGYEIFNKMAIDQWNIGRNATFEIVLVKSAYFNSLKGNLKQSSVDSYHQKYIKQLAILEQLQKEGKLKEQEYYKKLNELEDRYDSQLKNLDAYVDQFARIDLSELSEQEQQFIELAHAGRLDEAAEAYNTLNAAGKYITAVENVRKLNEDISKLEDEKAQQQEAAKTFFAMLQRQVNTLKLAGGEENYRKAGELLKRAALADTTNIDAVWVYANFAQDQHDFKEAERFWYICMRSCVGNPYQQAMILNNLGIIYEHLNIFSRAESFYLQSIERYSTLMSHNSDAYRLDLADTQNNLGNMYTNNGNYKKSEEYHLKALENYTLLLSQNIDALRYLSSTQNNLGILYWNLHDYVKAEKYYLTALTNFTQLFNKDQNTYRYYLAGIQNNLGALYYDLRDNDKAEEYLVMALENRIQLFKLNPDAYQVDLALTQNNLGALYDIQKDYTKAEDYLLKALDNRKHLFNRNPDAYRADLAMTQHNLGNLYYHLQDFTKAENYYIQALENETLLFNQNPDAYRTELATTQNNLGQFYYSVSDYTTAEKYYLMALENYSHLPLQDQDNNRGIIANIQQELGEIYLVACNI